VVIFNTMIFMSDKQEGLGKSLTSGKMILFLESFTVAAATYRSTMLIAILDTK